MNAIRKKQAGGFTLVEILIVVIILGILAAIVIPQFTNASTDARKSNLSSQVQTIRSQISLYKIQHNDTLPDLLNSDPTKQWTELTTQTDATGAAYVSGTSTTGPFGPYLQSIPTNPLTGAQLVVSTGTSAATTTGWYFDTTTGEFHGANVTGAQSDDGN